MVESANIGAKIRRAQAFWNRGPVDRPMIGFSLGGWFPLQDLALMRKALSLRGLYLQIVVESPEEAESLEEFFRPWN